MSLSSAMIIGMAPSEIGIAPFNNQWQKYLEQQNNFIYQSLAQPDRFWFSETVQTMQEHTLAPAIDPRIEAICNAAKKELAPMEKEVEARRAQLIEAAKAKPAAPPLENGCSSEALQKGDAQISQALSLAAIAVDDEPISPLQRANNIVMAREGLELQPGAAFRWIYRMGQ